MADFYGLLLNYVVMPSENDHYGDGYGGVGAGKIPTELLLTPLLQGLGHMPGFVSTGFAVPSSGSLTGSTITGSVTAGTAVIAGRRIEGTSNVGISVPISDTSYVWLSLELDGSNKVYRPIITTSTTFAEQANPSIPLGSITCDATSITSTKDMRFKGQIVWGAIETDGSNEPDFEDANSHMGSCNWVPSKVDATDLRITFNDAFHHAPWVFHSAAASAINYEKADAATHHDFATSGGNVVFLFLG